MSIEIKVRYADPTASEAGDSAESREAQVVIPGDGEIDTPQEARDTYAAVSSYTRGSVFSVVEQTSVCSRQLLPVHLQTMINNGRFAAEPRCVESNRALSTTNMTPREYRMACGDVELALNGTALTPTTQGRVTIGIARRAREFPMTGVFQVYFGGQRTPQSVALENQNEVRLVVTPPENFSGIAHVRMGRTGQTAFFGFDYPVSVGGYSVSEQFQPVTLFSRSNLNLTTQAVPATPTSQGFAFATIAMHSNANPPSVAPQARMYFVGDNQHHWNQSISRVGNTTLFMPANTRPGNRALHVYIYDETRRDGFRRERELLEFTFPVTVPEPPFAFSQPAILNMPIRVGNQNYVALDLTTNRRGDGELVVNGTSIPTTFSEGRRRYMIPVSGSATSIIARTNDGVSLTIR